MLEVYGLTYRYGSVTAVDGVSLAVAAGEAVTIIGANGAGKTTLVRSISGVLPAQEGRVLLDGRDVTRLAPDRIVRAGAVHVPEGRHLFPDQDVRTNLLLGGFARSRRAARLEKALDEIYTIFPLLADRATQPAGTLSGGEQQMVAIGRALMAQPQLLILDEPSMGLAPFVVRAIFETLQELKSRGMSLLLVEQNAQLALELTDRAYVMESGRMVLEGPSATLRNNPEVQAAYLGAAVGG